MPLAQTNAYDVIVLDLNLPGMDGLQILEEMRKRNLEQKVLISSARTSFRERIDSLDMPIRKFRSCKQKVPLPKRMCCSW